MAQISFVQMKLTSRYFFKVFFPVQSDITVLFFVFYMHVWYQFICDLIFP